MAISGLTAQVTSGTK